VETSRPGIAGPRRRQGRFTLPSPLGAFRRIPWDTFETAGDRHVHGEPHARVTVADLPGFGAAHHSFPSHTPALTAPIRTAHRGIACGSRCPPGRTRAARRRAAADPEPEDPVWPGVCKGKCIFISRKSFLSLKTPNKSILTLKIVKPFPESF
jgi:hypothetical protein